MPSRAEAQATQSIEALLLKARAVRYAQAVEQQSVVALRMVTFARAGGLFGCPIESLRAIRPVSQFCPIPGASPVVPGVAHYRGQVVSVHDLAAFVGLAGSPIGEQQWLLVVDHAGRTASLVADEVIDVIDLFSHLSQEVPVGLEACEGISSGMSQDGVLLLDIEKALSYPRFARAF